jgi:hypothetical protein
MRNPRQSRCTAAIWIIAAEMTSKHLAGDQNPGAAIFRRAPLRRWRERP